jgi:hypothetical protein
MCRLLGETVAKGVMTRPEWPKQYGDARVKTIICAACNNSVLVRHAHLADPMLWKRVDHLETPSPSTQKLRLQLGVPNCSGSRDPRRACYFLNSLHMPSVHKVADGIMDNETLRRMSMFSMKAGMVPEESSELNAIADTLR